MIDIEVVDAHLNHNILLGFHYMKAVASSVFHLMMFFHHGNRMFADQLTYSHPKQQSNPDNVLPTLESNKSMPSFNEVGLGVFKDSTLLGTYHGPSPPVLLAITYLMYTLVPVVE